MHSASPHPTKILKFDFLKIEDGGRPPFLQMRIAISLQPFKLSRSLICVQDYKSLCAAVTICATVVNIQTHTHTDRQHLISLYEQVCPK